MSREDIAREKVSVCPFLLFQTSEMIDTEEPIANLTNLRKAIGAAITDTEVTGIVSDIMRWINSNNDTLNGFVKTSKHLGASSLLTAIKNKCREDSIPVAYIACGSPKDEKSASDKFYYRLKDLLLQDNLTEKDVLNFFVKAFNLSNVMDSLSEMCRILNANFKNLDTEKYVAKIITFFKDNLNSIRKSYCDKYLLKSYVPGGFSFENSYRINYNEAYDVFLAYCNVFKISDYCSNSEEVLYDVQDGKVKSLRNNGGSKNVVILIDDFEMAVKEIIEDNLETRKKIFNNTKNFLNIIKSINSNAKGVKFVVPIRSCIYDIGNYESKKKPLYLSTGWEALFKGESGKKLPNILINLLNICDGKCNCNRKCGFIWEGTLDDDIFSKSKIKRLVKLCAANPYYLFRSFFCIHKGTSDGCCSDDADVRIKEYFKEQFKDDIFELLSLYILDLVSSDEEFRSFTLSEAADAAMGWVEEFVAHTNSKKGSTEYKICTVYARDKVSENDKQYGRLLEDRFIRKAIINALQDTGVIKLKKNSNPTQDCPEFCYPSTSKTYQRYYKDGKYRDFKAFFKKSYPTEKITIKEYVLHPFVYYIFSKDTIFQKEVA